MQLKYEALTWRRLGQLAEMYAAAFADNALYSALFRDCADPAAGLTWFFAARGAILLRAGCGVVVAIDQENDRLVAAAALAQPGDVGQ